jgi:hypothetical protein
MWTTEIPEGSIEFDFHAGDASLHVKNVLVFDAFTVPNSLDTHHPMGKVNAIINSLHMEWHCTVPRTANFCNKDNEYRGEYKEGTATIEVVATTPPRAGRCATTPVSGFRFVSEPAKTSVSSFAQIGRERNGVFY